jgi:hypothetical protein
LKKKLKRKKTNQTIVCLSVNIVSKCNKIHVLHNPVVHLKYRGEMNPFNGIFFLFKSSLFVWPFLFERPKLKFHDLYTIFC